MRIATAAVAALLLAVLPAAGGFVYVGHDYNKRMLAKVEEVRVFVGNGVTDGCLPQPDMLKAEAEMILRRSGIKVEEHGIPMRSHMLAINATGFSPQKGFCAVNLNIELSSLEALKDGTHEIVRAAFDGGLFFGPRETFQAYLQKQINKYVPRFANEILEARGH